jgi:hypothetical protein
MLRRTARLLGLLAFLAVALPLFADTVGDDTESNARVLDRWRTADPEHYARLRRDLRAFYNLPLERQEQLRRLDRELHELEPAAQKRLLAVLERYGSWLEHLSASDRQRIEGATDHAERLRIIRQIREQQWLEHLPYKVREELANLPEADRPEMIAKLKEEEHQRLAAYQRALKLRASTPSQPGKPALLAEFPAEVQTFVEESLKPMLNPLELKRLDDVDGQWPLLALTILELTEKHPWLPPLPTGPIKETKHLPQGTGRLLPKGSMKGKEGRWPDFALAVMDTLRKEGKAPTGPLGACKPADLAPEVQAFLRDKLPQAASTQEVQHLKDLEGKWPEYPRYLHELARKYQLAIPGLTLPGPKEIWENARSALPEVPDAILRQFALAELSQQDLAALQISLMDPIASRDKLKQEFFRRHPNKVAQFRQPRQ